MRYLYLLILLLFCSLSGIAQDQYPLKPLLEVFTSSTCPPCVYANGVIDSVLSNNTDNYSLIKYQADWPGAGDPYYIPDSRKRVDYYNVTGVPNAQLNGTSVDPPGSFNQIMLDAALAQRTGIKLDISSWINANAQLDGTVIITSSHTYNAGLILHLLVYEGVTTGNVGSNGETYFHNVAMHHVFDGDGFPLPALNTGDKDSLSFSINMNQTFMEHENDLYVLAFIQDNSNKEILQSETDYAESPLADYSVAIKLEDQDGNAIPEARLFLEEYGVKRSDASGQLVFKHVLPNSYNYDVHAMDHYSIDGNFQVSSDIDTTLIMERPDFLFFENFNGAQQPADWSTIVEAPNFIYHVNDYMAFFRQNQDEEDMILVAPSLDLTKAGVLSFETFDKTNGLADIILGTMNSIVGDFTPLDTFLVTVARQTHYFNLEGLNIQDPYLAFKFDGDRGTFFYFDNVIVRYGTSGLDQLFNTYQFKQLPVFPNPTKDKVYLHEAQKNDFNLIKIYNALGVCLFSGSFEDYLDFSHYSPGNYVLIWLNSKNENLKAYSRISKQ